ncbi:MAG: hypothetical protein IJU48_06575 [Synergistaceae bacterium]|nr:hypothetical protein [Synergistaceae bacterium]
MKRFFRDMRAYNKNNKRPEFHASLRNMWPCLNEWDAPAGSLGVYFYQDLWAAKKIFQVKPSEHFDIGSRVDGLNFIQADATNLDNTCSQ